MSAAARPPRKPAASMRNPPRPTSAAPSRGPATPARSVRNPADEMVDGAGDASQQKPDTNIKVVVRCRGRSEREVREHSPVVVSTSGNRGKEVALSMGALEGKNKLYTFDRVFGPEAMQSQIYDDVVAPLLDELLAGYNCTVFAYGQTGTGKTYTMSGDMSDKFGTFTDAAGIIPRALYKLFKRLDDDDGDNNVKCSFIELYNEELKDLLAADENSAKVKIFDDSTRKGGVIVQGMEEMFIRTAADGVKLLQEGSHKRQVAATKCNDLSSRSHTVFTITVQVKVPGDDGEDFLKTGKLNLVDLAGSECIGRSGAQDKRAREAGMINQSLLTLGRVINSLSEKSAHIPYRESKLTRLLQDSLGGRTKTCIIATISPSKANFEETQSTLDYASRAKNIHNKPQINEFLSKKTLIREYLKEIQKLKVDLMASRTKNGVFMSQDSFNEMADESESRRILNEQFESKVDVLEMQIHKSREQFEETMALLLGTKKELEISNYELATTKDSLQQTDKELANTKQSLSEETVLRKAHQQTEEKLDFVGRELISALDSSVGEISELHGKVSRMAELEVANHTIWTKNSGQVTDVTQAVEQEINEFTAEQQRVTDAVAKRIAGFVEKEKKKLEDTYGFIDERLASFKEKEGELAGETVRSKEEMNQVLEEIRVLRDEVKQRVGNGLQGINDAAQSIAADVMEDLGKFGDNLQSVFLRLGIEFRSLFDGAQEHIIAQKAEVEELRAQLRSATSVATTATETAQSSLETILTEERERANTDRQNLISQISTLINKTAEEQDRRLTKRVGLVQSEMQTAQVSLTTATVAYDQGMNVWAAKEGAYVQTLAQSKQAAELQLSQDKQKAEQHNAAIQAATRAIHEKTVRIVENAVSDLDTQMSSLDDFVTSARASNEIHHTAIEASISSLTSNALESFTRLSSETQDASTSLTSFGTEVSTATLSTLSSLAPFKDSTAVPLSGLRAHFDSNPLKEYTPTSSTPRKRKYSIPRTLPKTEPHATLLKEAGLRGENSEEETTRTPLSEIEVPPPNRNSGTRDDEADVRDPRAGGPGVGKAFYGLVNGPNLAPSSSSAAGEGGGKRGRGGFGHGDAGGVEKRGGKRKAEEVPGGLSPVRRERVKRNR